MTVFGNVGFIGFPVVSAIFGDSAIFYASIFNLPFNLLVYTIGVLFLTNGQKQGKMDWKLLVSPCVLASLVTLVIALGHIRVPSLVGEAMDLLGQVTTPAALLIIGSSLAKLPLKTVTGTPRIWGLAVLRLLVLPVLVWALLRLWLHNELILGIAVVITGMPVASVCTMLCLQYGGDQTAASQGTFVTTACSLVTIPLLASLLLG
jgi:predicted permease